MTDIGARESKAAWAGSTAANAIAFAIMVVLGCAYIALAKLKGVSQAYVTFGPVAVMIAYACLLAVRPLRLRDDQAGDNLYYMGFLFTLTSLGMSLYQFSAYGAAEQIVQNFGIAISSTIAGITLRIFFNQMRRDPIEVEAAARTELAEAARRVRRELDMTVLEFAHFRRAAQQMILDGFAETKLQVDSVGTELLGGLKDFATRSAAPLEAASKQSGSTIEELTRTTVAALERTATQLAAETERVSKGASAIAAAIETVSGRLAAMQTPDHVIEVKLTPTIQGLSRAVNAFGKAAGERSANLDAALASMAEATTRSAELVAGLKSELAGRDGMLREALEATRRAAEAAAQASETMRTGTQADAARARQLTEELERVLAAATSAQRAEAPAATASAVTS